MSDKCPEGLEVVCRFQCCVPGTCDSLWPTAGEACVRVCVRVRVCGHRRTECLRALLAELGLTERKPSLGGSGEYKGLVGHPGVMSTDQCNRGVHPRMAFHGSAKARTPYCFALKLFKGEKCFPVRCPFKPLYSLEREQSYYAHGTDEKLKLRDSCPRHARPEGPYCRSFLGLQIPRSLYFIVVLDVITHVSTPTSGQ